jgi:parallel beta-helix repeat protein
MITMLILFRRLIVILILFAMILPSTIVYAYKIESTEKYTNINLVLLDAYIIIPDDFPTIQEGIDNSNVGDVIFVRTGIYKENIVIDKERLYLLGEDKFNTVIDIENNKGHGIKILADGVTVEEFTVTNARCSERLYWDQSGIIIYSSNVTIQSNIISYNRLGVMSSTAAFNITVRDNIFIEDGFIPACYIQMNEDEYIVDNKVPLESIYITIENNSVNGRPQYYLKDLQNFEVNSDAGQVILVNCTNVTVKNLYLHNIDFSIMLYYCSNCTIENSTIVNTEGELILFFSENNTIQNMSITNAFHGTCIDIGSKNNIVRNNKYYDCLQGITVMTATSGNRVYNNLLKNAILGVGIVSVYQNLPAFNNYVYENEFIGCKIALDISKFEHPNCDTFDNKVENNNFSKNFIGVKIYKSDGNLIQNNTFQKNIFSALIHGKSKNTWNNNYWNRPRVLPKIIFGYELMFDKIPVPCCWLNIDKHPAKNI